MFRQRKHWLLCGALALPVGFGIGYAIDARIPEAKAKSYEAPLSALPSAPVAEKPAVREKITLKEPSKEPERATPPPAPPREKIAVKESEKTPTPPPAAKPPAPETPAPVTVDPPSKAPPSALKMPRLNFDKSSISLDDDQIKVRTPYGSFRFSF